MYGSVVKAELMHVGVCVGKSEHTVQRINEENTVVDNCLDHKWNHLKQVI